MDKVCILVCSHNNKDLTDSLCRDIISHTKGVDYDLHVIETGSDLNNCSEYMTLWVKDKIRMTRGFNMVRAYAMWQARKTKKIYNAYQFFVNDAKFIDDQDLVSTLYHEMQAHPDCGQIHPYQSNIQEPFGVLNKRNPSGPRKESFCEFICPMLAPHVAHGALDDAFFYGWGLDYDIPYNLHLHDDRTYISDTVGIFHEPFTSYREAHITKEKLTGDEFGKLARQNMNEVMIAKYGPDWKQVIYDAVPEDVSKEALYLWLHHQEGFNSK